MAREVNYVAHYLIVLNVMLHTPHTVAVQTCPIEILFLNLKYPSRQNVASQTFQILQRAPPSISRILWDVKSQGKNLPKFYTVKCFLIFPNLFVLLLSLKLLFYIMVRLTY